MATAMRSVPAAMAARARYPDCASADSAGMCRSGDPGSQQRLSDQPGSDAVAGGEEVEVVEGHARNPLKIGICYTKNFRMGECTITAHGLTRSRSARVADVERSRTEQHRGHAARTGRSVDAAPIRTARGCRHSQASSRAAADRLTRPRGSVRCTSRSAWRLSREARAKKMPREHGPGRKGCSHSLGGSR